MRIDVRQLRRAVVAGLAVALVVLTAACSPSSGETPEVADAGYQAGDGTYTAIAPAERGEAVELTGATFEGGDVDLAAWRGDVVVLNFWYAGCPPCRAEAPDLAAIATDYDGDGVRLLGINGTDDAATVAAFNETFAVPYPSLEDRDARGVLALNGLVPLRAMPSTVVLDRQGRPAAVVVGKVEGATLRGIIDDVLAEA